MCVQLEKFEREVKDVHQKDKNYNINPRGYLEDHLANNKNMDEVSVHFRWIRDALFGKHTQCEGETNTKQKYHQLAFSLTDILNNPPVYTPFDNKHLNDI